VSHCDEKSTSIRRFHSVGDQARAPVSGDTAAVFTPHRGNHEHDRHTGRKRGCGDPHETVVPMLRVHREPSAYRRGRIAP